MDLNNVYIQDRVTHWIQLLNGIFSHLSLIFNNNSVVVDATVLKVFTRARYEDREERDKRK